MNNNKYLNIVSSYKNYILEAYSLSTSQSQDQVEGRLFLDVVVRQGSAILELLSSKDESLLIWGDSFLVLDLGLDIFNGVSRLDVKSDGLTSQCLDEDLHTTSESKNEMEGRLLLDVIIGQSSSIFQLLACEDKSLLVWGNSFFVLDLSLHVLNGVSGFNVQSDGLSSESLDKDLHTSSKSEDQVEGALLLDVVVRESSAILKLLSCEDESLLIWWDAFLVLDLGLDILNSISRLNIEGDGFAGEGLDENLHDCFWLNNYNLSTFIRL